ncbi:MAG: DNA gyrase subunit A, partial [Anaerotruncus massiliensis (ex Togo et al. 2019)]
MPRVCGVKELIEEWPSARAASSAGSTTSSAKEGKAPPAHGTQKILLDIDKAIRIVRETAEEREVVPNLMIGFGIDEVQAEYVAEIKLRQLNREHILKRVEETDQLKKEIAGMEEILADRKKVRAIIIDELRAVSKKYAKPRKSLLYYPSGEDEEEPE